ncbi:hypothetical protein PHMEG_0009376 [Phytophthora megakarya]|uniref:Uncharacterized protein n=1 Tax=Phytophthora megakarya TaxID=4795 RepID=A0A225WHA2_9STRA|nr:hypothetical protein PHMEG_0009376 [Phytophthora megakarya]
MQNLSAAVTIPTPSSPESIEDIPEALQSLATYSTEYFSNVLSELVDKMVRFTKQQLRQNACQQIDLVLVVYWMNLLLQSFRMELE